jgi:hypothetical protein
VARQVFSRCRPSEMAEHVASVLLQQSDQIASSPVATEVSCRMFAARISGQAAEQVFELARPAGFEPATRCLEGTFEGSLDVAWRRSRRRLRRKQPGFLAGAASWRCREAKAGGQWFSLLMRCRASAVSYEPGVAFGGLDLASGHNAPFCGFPTGAG